MRNELSLRLFPPAPNLLGTYISIGRKSLTSTPKTVKGKSKAPIEEDDEEAELAKLQAEMAM